MESVDSHGSSQERERKAEQAAQEAHYLLFDTGLAIIESLEERFGTPHEYDSLGALLEYGKDPNPQT